MILGNLDPKTNRLSNICIRPSLPGDVELASWPDGRGPWAYDPTTKTAIPAPPTPDEQVASAAFAPGLLAALALRLSSSWPTLPAAEQAVVQSVIDGAAAPLVTTAGPAPATLLAQASFVAVTAAPSSPATPTP